MPKGDSGIRRGGGGGKLGKTEDVTYEVKHSSLKNSLGIKMESEAFRKIYEAPAGTRITVHYSGFGSSGTGYYVINTRGGGNKKALWVMDDSFTRRRNSYAINSVANLKNRLYGAKSITIHGRDFDAEAREARRQDREFWAGQQRANEKQ